MFWNFEQRLTQSNGFVGIFGLWHTTDWRSPRIENTSTDEDIRCRSSTRCLALVRFRGILFVAKRLAGGSIGDPVMLPLI